MWGITELSAGGRLATPWISEGELPTLPRPPLVPNSVVDVEFRVYFPHTYEDPDGDVEYKHYYFGTTAGYFTSSDDALGGVTNSVIHTETVELNKTYYFWLGGSLTYETGTPVQFSKLINHNVRFTVPDGYILFINSVAKNNYTNEVTSGYQWFAVTVVPTSSFGGAGTDLVNFDFDLGPSPDGGNLGVVSLPIEGVPATINRSMLKLSSDEVFPNHIVSSTSGSSLIAVECPAYKILFSEMTSATGVCATFYDKEHISGDTYAYAADPIKSIEVSMDSSGTQLTKRVFVHDGNGGTSVLVNEVIYEWDTLIGAWDYSRSSSSGLEDEANFNVSLVSPNPYSTGRTLEYELSDGYGNVATRTQSHLDTIENKEREVKSIEFVGNEKWVTTYEYFSGTSDTEINGMLKSVLSPDGSKIRYEYFNLDDGNSFIKRMFSCYKNSEDLKVFEFEYSENWLGEKNLVSQLTETISGTVLGKTTFSHLFSGNNVTFNYNGLEALITESKQFYGSNSSDFLTTKSAIYRDDVADLNYANKVIYEIDNAGNMTYVSRTEGEVVLDSSKRFQSFDPSNAGGWRIITYTGTNKPTNAGGGLSISIGSDTTIFYPVPGLSTRLIQYFDSRGFLVKEVSSIYAGNESTSWSTISLVWPTTNWKEYLYNQHGQITHIYSSESKNITGAGVPSFKAGYNNMGQLVWEEDISGYRKSYSYYGSGLLKTVSEMNIQLDESDLGLSYYQGDLSQPSILNTYSYDAAGRILQKVIGSQGTEQLIEDFLYYESGRPKKVVGINATGVEYTYYLPTGSTGMQIKKTPLATDGTANTSASTTVTYLKDGRISSISGCGSCSQVDQFFDYSYSAFEETKMKFYKAMSSDHYEIQTVDAFGRTIYSAKTSTQAGNLLERALQYNALNGLLEKIEETGVSDVRFLYHNGVLVKKWLDHNGNGVDDAVLMKQYLFLNINMNILLRDGGKPIQLMLRILTMMVNLSAIGVFLANQVFV